MVFHEGSADEVAVALAVSMDGNFGSGQGCGEADV